MTGQRWTMVGVGVLGLLLAVTRRLKVVTMPTQHQDLNDIVSHALEIASEKKRAAYIAETCGGDAELKRRVEQKVAEHFQSGDQEKSPRAADDGGQSSERDPEQNGVKQADAERRSPERDREQHAERQSPEQGGNQNGAKHADGEKRPLERDREQTRANQQEGREPPKRIGLYEIVKQIGEGVTAIVFQGEQQEPQQLKVALKVIKVGMDWRQIAARFEAEKPMLSRLDHPNIAKVLGNGTWDAGQPYFVLELVEGLPITKYCDKQKLSLQRRLELFISVCQAVQYAHQNSIVHGDLKPSNVLVSSKGDKPQPKILDLGIAKATRRKPNEKDPSLDPGVLGGKPEYLSPERADADVPNIDTRSDVYSLGVLLYELLTDTTPLMPEQLKDVSRTEILQLIREEEAPPASARLEKSKDRLSSVAERCQMKPRKLIKAVRGDLDCVVKKALQKERAQRYETVHALGRDIQRYLAGEPIEACPPSGLWRIWKLAKKDTMTLATIAGVLFLLLTLAFAGTGLGAWMWWEEHKEYKAEQKAEEERKEAEEKEKELESKLEKSEQVAEIREKERDKARKAQQDTEKSENQVKGILVFLKKQLLSAGRPGDVSMSNAFWAGIRSQEDAAVRQGMTLREAVNETESRVAGMFANQPMAEATVREMLGWAYLNLGEATKAVQQYKRAFELRKAIKGVDDPETADCNNQLAIAYRLAGRHDAASRLFHRTPRSPAEAEALAIRGSVLLTQKRPGEAELKFRDCLDIRRKIQPDDWTTFETESLLGESLLEQGKDAEAESWLLSGYHGMQDRVSKMSDQGKNQLTRAVERLVRLYESWGDKLDEVAKWRRELETIKATNNP